MKAKKKGVVGNVTLNGSHAFKFVVPRAKNTMSVDNKLMYTIVPVYCNFLLSLTVVNLNRGHLL